MEIIVPLIVIVLETSISAYAFILSLVLWREWQKWRKGYFLVGCVHFLAVSVEFLFAFMGQMLYANGVTDLAAFFLDQGQGVMLSISASTWLFIMARLLLPERYRKAVAALIVVMALFGATRVVITPPSVVIADGLPISGLTTVEFMTDLLPLFTEFVLLALYGVFAFVRMLFGKRLERPYQGALAWSGLWGLLLLSLYIGVAGGALPISVLGLTFLFTPLFLSAQFSGLVAYEHPMKEIRERPRRIFVTSIFVKLGASNVILIGAVGMLLVGVTTFLYHSAVTRANDAAMLRFVTDEMAMGIRQENRLISLAEWVASDVAASGFTGADPGVSVDIERQRQRIREIESVISKSATNLTLELVQVPTGRVLTMFGEAVTAPDMLPLIGGRQETAVQVLARIGGAFQAIMVATPVGEAARDWYVVAYGTQSGQLAGSGGFPADLPKPTAYGTLSMSGEQLITAGAVATADIVALARTADLADTATLHAVPGVGKFYVARSPESGTISYVFRSTQEEVNEFLPIIFNITYAALAISLMLAFFEFYVISRTLSSIRGLVDATHRVTEGKYEARADISALDEVGDLARSFNAMADMIERNTHALEGLVQEQRDTLINTALELRTPLNHIRWTLELLRFGDVGKFTAEQLEYLEQLHVMSARLEHVVRNIIDTDRLAAGKVALSIAPEDLEDVINEAAGELAVPIREKGLTFEWAGLDAGFPKVAADREQLVRVVLNILGNAVKYTDRDGRITVRVSRVAGPDGTQLAQVEIEDNGRGIPAKDQPRIFSKFFRASNVMGKDIEGSGLGLYIASALVVLMGGKMWFRSKEREGSTFAFTVPVAVDTPTL